MLYAKLFKRRLPPSRGSRVVILIRPLCVVLLSLRLTLHTPTAFYPKRDTGQWCAAIFHSRRWTLLFRHTRIDIHGKAMERRRRRVWVMTSAPPRGDSAAAGKREWEREWQSVNATNQALPTEIMERVIEIAPRFHVQSEWVTRHVPLPALNIVITGNHPPFICWKSEIYKKE